MLDRYNKYLFAAVGTVLLFVLMAGVLLAGFEVLRKPHEPEGVNLPTAGAKKPDQNLAVCPPITIENSPLQYFPVAAVSGEDASKNPVVYQSSFQSKLYGRSWNSSNCGYGERPGDRVFNVVLRNSKTNEQSLLFSKPTQIASIATPDPKCDEGEGLAPCGSILWTIRDSDSNQDGVLNTKDSLSAYISKIGSNQLQLLSPKQSSVQLIRWLPNSKEILVQVTLDKNSDGEFTLEDGSEILVVSEDGLSPTKSVLEPEVQTKLNQAIQ